MIKTVTLETAKALKEAGFHQEVIAGDWYWVITSMGKVRHLLQGDNEDNISTTPFKWYKSPSTDELLEELPEFILHRFKKSCFIRYLYGRNLLNEVTFENESLCECLAQMYLYLASNKLLEGV